MGDKRHYRYPFIVKKKNKKKQSNNRIKQKPLVMIRPEEQSAFCMHSLCYSVSLGMFPNSCVSDSIVCECVYVSDFSFLVGFGSLLLLIIPTCS